MRLDLLNIDGHQIDLNTARDFLKENSDSITSRIENEETLRRYLLTAPTAKGASEATINTIVSVLLDEDDWSFVDEV